MRPRHRFAALAASLAVALAGGAASTSGLGCKGDPAGAPVVAGAPAGDVREVSGAVTATRAGATRPLAVGDVVSGDDVVRTGADGRVTIALRHNEVTWSLGPGQEREVARSVAWSAPRGTTAGDVAGDVRSTAAGRHAEREAAGTSSSAPPVAAAAPPAPAAEVAAAPEPAATAAPLPPPPPPPKPAATESPRRTGTARGGGGAKAPTLERGDAVAVRDAEADVGVFDAPDAARIAAAATLIIRATAGAAAADPLIAGARGHGVAMLRCHRGAGAITLTARFTIGADGAAGRPTITPAGPVATCVGKQLRGLRSPGAAAGTVIELELVLGAP